MCFSIFYLKMNNLKKINITKIKFQKINPIR